MKKIILIISLYVIAVPAQDFRLGFGLEAHQIRINYQDNNHILGGNGLPLAIHLNLTYDLLEELKLLAKVGRSFHEEFRGWEFGITGRYNFFLPFSAATGILLHSNEGGGVSNGYSISYASILMLQAGLGVNLSRVFSIELNYYKPFSEKEIQKVLLYDEKTSSYYWESRTFYNMLTLNFIFAWEL